MAEQLRKLGEVAHDSSLSTHEVGQGDREFKVSWRPQLQGALTQKQNIWCKLPEEIQGILGN